MSTTAPAAGPAVDATARSAAEAAAALVPAPAPLVVVVADGPPPTAEAVVAAVVGAAGAEVALVLGPAVAEALAAGGPGIVATDALRPALEAAAAVLGPGVLEPARSTTAAAVLGPDTQVLALQADGETVAWCTVRTRGRLDAPPTVIPSPRTAGSLRVLYDVEMTLTAEIGRARLPLRQVLDLTPGAVLELDRAAGSPADIVVNGRLIARGEVVVVDEDYGVRVTEIVAGTDAAG